MRVAVPPELSAWIAARIANYAAEATEPYHRWESAAVAEFAALPLIRHWAETFGLRADGEVVRWHTDLDEPYPGVRPVEERYDWLSALVEGRGGGLSWGRSFRFGRRARGIASASDTRCSPPARCCARSAAACGGSPRRRTRRCSRHPPYQRFRDV